MRIKNVATDSRVRKNKKPTHQRNKPGNFFERCDQVGDQVEYNRDDPQPHREACGVLKKKNHRNKQGNKPEQLVNSAVQVRADLQGVDQNEQAEDNSNNTDKKT